MTIRTKRRLVDGQLETMADAQLDEIRFFGTLYADAKTLSFVATPEERERAAEILKQRGVMK